MMGYNCREAKIVVLIFVQLVPVNLMYHDAFWSNETLSLSFCYVFFLSRDRYNVCYSVENEKKMCLIYGLHKCSIVF